MTSIRRVLRRLLRPVLVPGRRATRMMNYRVPHRLARELVQSGAIRLVVPTTALSRATTQEFEAVAERVIRAHRLALAEEPADASPTGLWDSLIRHEYAQLTKALASHSPQSVAEVLEAMFATSTTSGLSMGAELEWLSTAGGRAFFIRWWIDGALSLGAYLGHVAEEMETGDSTIRSGDEFVDLLAVMASDLAIELKFPRVCNAWGVEHAGALVPRSGWRHLHSARVLADLVGNRSAPVIAEVGGGFGGVAYWLNRLVPAARATLYDFPIVNAIAGYFLIRAGVPTRLLGESGNEPAVSVLPYWRLFDEPDRSVDVVFNQDSLAEMPRETAARYLRTFDRIARVGFYSENQESATPWRRGDPSSAQLRLPDLDSELRQLRLSYRHRAWMRRGYFEALYRAPGEFD